MKFITGMLIQILDWANHSMRKLSMMLSTKRTLSSKKSNQREDTSNTESQSSQDQEIPPVSEGTYRDKDGSLVMITKLNDDEFLFTHETEGSCVIDKYGNQIVSKYEEI